MTIQLVLLITMLASLARAQLSQQASSGQQQISSYPIYGAPMYQQNSKLSFDSLQTNDPEYEPTFYRTRNRYFLRDKKKQQTAERELEEREPLTNHRRKSAPVDSVTDERASRCYNAMSIESNKIIDSSASTKNGAVFLSVEKISILSSQFSLKEVQQRCMQHCCDSGECDSSLLSLKMGQDGYRCYLFKCDDRCIYIKHSDYVVLRSKTPEQLDQTNKVNDKPMTNQEVLNRPCHESYEFRCKSDGRCIAIYDVCDSINHCADKSDEANCNKTVEAPPKQASMYNSKTDEPKVKPVTDNDLDDYLQSDDLDSVNYESELAKQQSSIIKHLKELEQQKTQEKLNKKKVVYETDKNFLDSFMKPSIDYSDHSLINTYKKIKSPTPIPATKSSTKFIFHDNFGMNAGAMYSGGGWSPSDSDSALRAMKTSLVRPEDKIYFDPTSSKSSTASVSLAIILLVLGMGMVVGFFAYLIGNTRFVKNRLSQQLNRMRMRQHEGADKNLEVDGDYLINGMYL